MAAEGANPPRRRRRRASADGAAAPRFEDLPEIESWCAACLERGAVERQRRSPSGVTCRHGHGGDPGVSRDQVDAAARELRPDGRELEVASSGTLVARDGDSLHVRFPEVTLPLRAKYASAKVGGLSMTRTLEAGEDVGEVGARMASALREMALRIARETIADFDAELEEARKRS